MRRVPCTKDRWVSSEQPASRRLLGNEQVRGGARRPISLL